MWTLIHTAYMHTARDDRFWCRICLIPLPAPGEEVYLYLRTRAPATEVKGAAIRCLAWITVVG